MTYQVLKVRLLLNMILGLPRKGLHQTSTKILTAMALASKQFLLRAENMLAFVRIFHILTCTVNIRSRVGVVLLMQIRCSCVLNASGNLQNGHMYHQKTAYANKL